MPKPRPYINWKRTTVTATPDGLTFTAPIFLTPPLVAWFEDAIPPALYGSGRAGEKPPMDWERISASIELDGRGQGGQWATLTVERVPTTMNAKTFSKTVNGVLSTATGRADKAEQYAGEVQEALRNPW